MSKTYTVHKKTTLAVDFDHDFVLLECQFCGLQWLRRWLRRPKTEVWSTYARIKIYKTHRTSYYRHTAFIDMSLELDFSLLMQLEIDDDFFNDLFAGLCYY